MIKPAMLHVISRFHMSFHAGRLPDRLAVYFHELEPWQRPKLAEALSYLVDHGYQAVDAAGFIAPEHVSGKRIFLSFDDNFRGWHHALELFARHGVKCTFYTNTAPIRDLADRETTARYFDRIRYAGDDETLSQNEIREIHAAGHTIGCHTHAHPVLAQLPRNRWDDEIRASRDQLAEMIGAPIVDLSFPFGMRRHFSPALREYCIGLGFRTIATGISGLQHANADPYNLHRTSWRFDLSLVDNLRRLSVQAPVYGRLLGRCAVSNAGWAMLPATLPI